MDSQAFVFNRDSLRAALSPAGLLSLFGLWVGYRILLALYNISPLHPLYRFPGPKKAAVSYAYEAYHDWWLAGRYTHQIRAMHERYGQLLNRFPFL